jgi:hypothetical protein
MTLQAARETATDHIPRGFAMKRSAAQYAVLSPLLDEALRLEDAARVEWLARLPEEFASYRPALDRILGLDSVTTRRRLSRLELRLRSCGRGVGVLVLAEFDRRKK